MGDVTGSRVAEPQPMECGACLHVFDVPLTDELTAPVCPNCGHVGDREVSTEYPVGRVTPDTPLRCDRCAGEWTVAQAEARPYSCPNDCYMGPRWQTLDGLPYFPKATETDA
jgi:hypothetical protein